jgi:hypothetical protein
MARRKKRGDAKLLTLDRRTRWGRTRADAAARMRSLTSVVASEEEIVGCIARIVPHKRHTLK